jgi:hypothetical protein
VEKTYTEDEHNAVLAQVADLEAKVAELSASQEASALDAAVAAVKAEMETQISELQGQLDTAVLEAEAAPQLYGIGGQAPFAAGSFPES